MNIFFPLTALFMLGMLTAVTAVSEPVCSYKNSQGETVFLKYLPYLKKGEDYVDFGANGLCTKQATCTETFKTEVEDCSKYPVSCSNKNTFNGVFPACCVKC
ncbi:uncharacterized protein LOC119673423 [Teleopsis dalmanni]|uniref:uncharacterized protein LOC119667820 n=1 Tax=Teleopsis dalmanni TaxID=139649 RepID=UPI0018CFC3ED|nr:uncharacterized protein LOC119667820 [Teleopsis dalmanni]XP_037940620.1 uncharacterized protein LOC119673423 [Teleopsis dalmanni]